MEYRERVYCELASRFPLRSIKGADSRHIFVSSSARGAREGKTRARKGRGWFTSHADVISVRAIHSARRGEPLPFRCSSPGKDFTRIYIYIYIVVTLCLLSFEQTGTRCYRRNKRSRLNASLAIRAINAHPR